MRCSLWQFREVRWAAWRDHFPSPPISFFGKPQAKRGSWLGEFVSM